MSQEYGQGNNTMKYVLPDPPDPPDFVCYLVRVPNSKFHITAFLGSIYDLSLWWNWERDEAHTASIAARRWRNIWQALKPVPCEVVFPDGGCPDCEDEMGCCCQKYIHGVLSTKDCNGNYVPVPSDAAGPGSSTSPAPQPSPGGGQQAYNVCLSAKEQKIADFGVSAGDTISIESYSGAWNDPSNDGFTWRGPTGLAYVFGNYVPGTNELIGTDPLPTAPHMSIVALINGTYYQLAGATFIVPGGISNAQVIFQANDSNLADNQGDVCVTLNVVNNQPTEWQHVFDFTAGALGWTAQGRNGSAAAGLLVPGTGWTPSDVTESTGAGFRRVDIVSPAIAPRTITGIDIYYAFTGGVFIPTSDFGLFTASVNGGTNFYSNRPSTALVNGAGQVDGVNASNAAQTSLAAYLSSCADPSGAHSGSCLISKIVVRGLGTDPF